MKIGIDISQIAYEGTGVANYTQNLVENLLKIDKQNDYVLFFSSLRRKCPATALASADKQNVKLKRFLFPPTFLNFLWNRLHICPIEWFIGDVDVFITSDWTEPPTARAKKITILHDLVIYKYPKETDKRIVQTQQRKLKWVKKESDMVICVSEATENDAKQILGIEEKRLRVIYEGGGEKC